MASIEEVIRGLSGITYLWGFQETSSPTEAKQTIGDNRYPLLYTGEHTTNETGPVSETKAVNFKNKAEAHNTEELPSSGWNSEYTIGLFFKSTEKLSKPQNLIGWEGRGGARDRELYIGSDGKLHAFMVPGEGFPEGLYLDSTSEYANNAWHLVVLTYSVAESKAILYVDGSNIKEATNSAHEDVAFGGMWKVSKSFNGGAVAHGGSNGGGECWLKGLAAYAFVCTKAITAEKVTKLHEATGVNKGPSVTNPGAQFGKVGTAVELQLTQTGATSFTGTLPAGLSINNSGKITGTPTKIGIPVAKVVGHNAEGETFVEWAWRLDEAEESPYTKKVRGLNGVRLYIKANEEEGDKVRDLVRDPPGEGVGSYSGQLFKGQTYNTTEGKYELAAGTSFLTRDNSKGIKFTSNSGSTGSPYGAGVNIAEEASLPAEKKALIAPTNKLTIGIILEPTAEPFSTSNIFGPIDESVDNYGYTLQVDSSDHHVEVEGEPMQLMMYVMWVAKGHAETVTSSKVIKKVSLPAVGWENLEAGKTLIFGTRMFGGESAAGENGSNRVTEIIKAETTPGVSEDGELKTEHEPTSVGSTTITVTGRANIMTKQKLPFNTPTHVVVVYDGTQLGPERVKYYFNGKRIEVKQQTTQSNNYAWGGIPAPTQLTYSTLVPPTPPRICAVNGGSGALQPQADSFIGRWGEVFLTTAAMTEKEVVGLYETALGAGLFRYPYITAYQEKLNSSSVVVYPQPNKVTVPTYTTAKQIAVVSRQSELPGPASSELILGSATSQSTFLSTVMGEGVGIRFKATKTKQVNKIKIVKIGENVEGEPYPTSVRVAIFTNNAGSGKPNTIVANSEGVIEAGIHKEATLEATGLAASLTENTEYWICILPIGGTIKYRQKEAGSTNRLDRSGLKEGVEEYKTLSEITVWAEAPITTTGAAQLEGLNVSTPRAAQAVTFPAEQKSSVSATSINLNPVALATIPPSVVDVESSAQSNAAQVNAQVPKVALPIVGNGLILAKESTGEPEVYRINAKAVAE